MTVPGGCGKHMILKKATLVAPVTVAICLGSVYSAGDGKAAGQEAVVRRPYGLEVDGHRWVGWSPEEQMAFLQGFLGGSAAAQAAEAGGARDGQLDAWTAELADPSLAQRLRFRFAPTVYLARLQDYYFYRDRRDQPVAVALTVINHGLLTEHF